jgi:hypothetical protein
MSLKNAGYKKGQYLSPGFFTACRMPAFTRVVTISGICQKAGF